MEAPATSFDLRFRVLGIPVRVHPFFWLATAVLGVGRGAPANTVVWMLAVFVSVVVHELGHALAARQQGHKPWIVLWWLGGLTYREPRRETTGQRVWIAAAGPVAGFALGGLIAAAVLGAGFRVYVPGLEISLGSGAILSGGRLELFVFDLLFVNLFYGALMLLPIEPLDGGEIARALLERYAPGRAHALVLQLGFGTAVLIALCAALLWQSVLLTAMFGFMAVQLWQRMKNSPRLRAL